VLRRNRGQNQPLLVSEREKWMRLVDRTWWEPRHLAGAAAKAIDELRVLFLRRGGRLAGVGGE
jgi:hypothetical protein